MALHDITQKILDDANAEAQRIRRDAKAQIKRIIADAEAQKKARERASDQETERIIAQRERAALSRARRGAQQAIAAAKRAAIDDVLARVRAAIVDADDARYAQFLTRFIAAVPEGERGAISAVRVPPQRRAVTQDVLAKTGITAPLTDDATIDAGVVLVGADADYDLTLARVLADRARELEAQITQKLFGTQQ